MREVTYEELRGGLLMQFGDRVWRVGYLYQIRLSNGNYMVEDPMEVTNVYSQMPADK